VEGVLEREREKMDKSIAEELPSLQHRSFSKVEEIAQPLVSNLAS
jgi:hypothetical protein